MNFYKKVQQQFMCYSEKSNQRFQELEKLIGLATQQVEKLFTRVYRRRSIRIDSSLVRTKQKNEQEDEEPLYHLKVGILKFTEGSGVSQRLQNCEQYFTVFKIENAKKAAIAGMHLEGLARRWFPTYSLERNAMKWTDFCQQLIDRFEV